MLVGLSTATWWLALGSDTPVIGGLGAAAITTAVIFAAPLVPPGDGRWRRSVPKTTALWHVGTAISIAAVAFVLVALGWPPNAVALLAAAQTGYALGVTINFIATIEEDEAEA